MPFALSNPAVASIGVTAVEKVHQEPWLGSINPSAGWMWIDNFCLLVNTSIIHILWHYNSNEVNDASSAHTLCIISRMSCVCYSEWVPALHNLLSRCWGGFHGRCISSGSSRPPRLPTPKSSRSLLPLAVLLWPCPLFSLEPLAPPRVSHHIQGRHTDLLSRYRQC